MTRSIKTITRDRDKWKRVYEKMSGSKQHFTSLLVKEEIISREINNITNNTNSTWTFRIITKHNNGVYTVMCRMPYTTIQYHFNSSTVMTTSKLIHTPTSQTHNNNNMKFTRHHNHHDTRQSHTTTTTITPPPQLPSLLPTPTVLHLHQQQQ